MLGCAQPSAGQHLKKTALRISQRFLTVGGYGVKKCYFEQRKTSTPEARTLTCSMPRRVGDRARQGHVEANQTTEPICSARDPRSCVRTDHRKSLEILRDVWRAVSLKYRLRHASGAAQEGFGMAKRSGLGSTITESRPPTRISTGRSQSSRRMQSLSL